MHAPILSDSIVFDVIMMASLSPHQSTTPYLEVLMLITLEVAVNYLLTKGFIAGVGSEINRHPLTWSFEGARRGDHPQVVPQVRRNDFHHLQCIPIF